MSEKPSAPSAKLRQRVIATREYPWGEILRRLWPLLRPYRGRIVVASVLVALVGVAVSVIPLFTKYVIDEALPRRSVGLAAGAMGLFVVIQFARMGIWYVAQRNVMLLREGVVFGLRAHCFHHLQRLCLRFHNQYSPGFLYEQVFGRSMASVTQFLVLIFNQVTVYVSGLLFSVVICLKLSVAMTVVVAAGAAGYVLVARWIGPKMHRLTREVMSAQNQVVEFIMDKLRGTKTIQAFSLEDRVEAEFRTHIENMQEKNRASELQVLQLQFVTEGLGYLITAVVLIVGANAVLNWQLPVGTLVAFVAYQGTLIGLISQLANAYGQFATAQAGFEELFAVLDTRTTVVEKSTAHMPATVPGRLELAGVRFAYQDRAVVNDLNLVVPPGQTVALVGRSGSGKSTILNLLLRFYDPDHGTIRLDGQDIRELPLRPYRRLYAVVLQDPYLFNDTIAVNLRCARPAATDAELRETLRHACALDFVDALPDGLQYRVGEGGTQLSGGQRQRLAIARAMMLRPQFVLLDEPTAALDNESEHQVQRSLQALFEGRTVFIIAHRLSTIRNADRILVIDEGRIVEDGRYAELLARDGLFSHLQRLATSKTSPQVEEAGFA